MDRGRLVERGTHAELFARSGVYAELVATQLAGG
jgi:ABC-type multidrug transport system fused ATPase/permease subunit